jgi:hypothetical protein
MEDPSGPPTPGAPACQACGAGLMALRDYFHRVKICEVRSKGGPPRPRRTRQLQLRRAVPLAPHTRTPAARAALPQG